MSKYDQIFLGFFCLPGRNSCTLWKIYSLEFLSYWKEYDRSDSFPFDYDYLSIKLVNAMSKYDQIFWDFFCRREETGALFGKYILGFFSSWKEEYDRSDSFPFDYQLIGSSYIPLKLKRIWSMSKYDQIFGDFLPVGKKRALSEKYILEFLSNRKEYMIVATVFFLIISQTEFQLMILCQKEASK